MAGLKPSANLFALLEGNDAGDTDAVKAAELEANTPKNINKKQQPQQTVWKANVNTAAPASAAKNKKKKQPAGGKNKKPPPPPQQQRAASSRANVNGAANAAKNHKQQQQPAAAFKAKTGTAAGSTANLTEELFGRAYPSARYLIYQNRKPKAPANEKDGGVADAKDGAAAGGAEAQDKKGGQEAEWQQVGRSKRAVPPAPAQEQPPAPVKPLPPPPPPPPTSLDDFPSLK